MTTVAYKDGIIAGDTQETMAGSVRLPHGPKIFVLSPDTIYGAAGDVNAIEYLKRFYSKPDTEWNFDDKKARKRAKHVEAILWHKGQVYCCEGDLIPIPIHASFYAIGSGWTFALSAMESGMGAEDAVKFASKFDVFTNDKVQVVNVQDLERTTRQGAKGRKAPRVQEAS